MTDAPLPQGSARSARFRSPLFAAATLVALLLIGTILVLTSPAEATLGEIVRIVYVHVALSRAGMLWIVAAGLLGLVVLVFGGGRIAAWMRGAGWAGLLLYAGGFAVSLIAQVTSWGGIAWREPRVMAAGNVLAVATIVQALCTWVGAPRLRGILRAALAAILIYANMRAVNVLHPGNAISGAASGAIQLSGYLLLAVALLLGGWIAWQARPRKDAAPPA